MIFCVLGVVCVLQSMMRFWGCFGVFLAVLVVRSCSVCVLQSMMSFGVVSGWFWGGFGCFGCSLLFRVCLFRFGVGFVLFWVVFGCFWLFRLLAAVPRAPGAARGAPCTAPSARQGARGAAPSRLGGSSAVGAAAAAPRPANNARSDWPRALCCVPAANRGGRGAVGVVQWRGRPGDSGRDRGGASERPQPPALPEGPQRYGAHRPRRRQCAGQPSLRPP